MVIGGLAVDISLALPGYEEALFARALDYALRPGQTIRLCSAEDLVIHKAVAGRPQDLIDIQGVVDRHLYPAVVARIWRGVGLARSAGPLREHLA